MVKFIEITYYSTFEGEALDFLQKRHSFLDEKKVVENKIIQ